MAIPYLTQTHQRKGPALARNSLPSRSPWYGMPAQSEQNCAVCGARQSEVRELVDCVAEREGFEPSIRGYRIHTFQACAFDHSATAPLA